MSLTKLYRKWAHRDFLIWRDELSDYEKNFLLPEVKSRCEVLLGFCKKIDTYCETKKGDHNLGVAIRKIMISDDAINLIPKDRQPPPPDVLARSYFTEIQDSNRATFLNDLESLVPLMSKNISLTELGQIFNKILIVAGAALEAQNELFLYRLSAIPLVMDSNSKQVVLGQPRELSLILHQFTNPIQNIQLISKSLIDTIQQWHKEVLNQKTEFLKLQTERIAQRNNLLTIIVAIAISWAFMMGTKPLEKYQLEKDNEVLREQIIEDFKKRTVLEEEIKALSVRVKELNEKIIQKDTK